MLHFFKPLLFLVRLENLHCRHFSHLSNTNKQIKSEAAMISISNATTVMLTAKNIKGKHHRDMQPKTACSFLYTMTLC